MRGMKRLAALRRLAAPAGQSLAAPVLAARRPALSVLSDASRATAGRCARRQLRDAAPSRGDGSAAAVASSLQQGRRKR